ncbi:MAG: hypothetical protein WDO17_11395 [Alphaproteobacteria bacterium]
MADAPPTGKLREYLLELKPQARALLASELERALLRGEAPPGTAAVLEQLRLAARREGRKLPRIGNPQRLFFAAVEPFLVSDIPERKHLGRIARASLDPIWKWICRDLMLREARTYSDQVQLLLAANERNGAEQVARAFQDLVEQRLRECLASIKRDEKDLKRVAGQIGTPHAIDEVRELAAILRARDALGVIGSRLPAAISNLAGEQLENVRALLDSPIGRHRDVFLYALLVVMSRLGSPWQLIRLAIHAAVSDAADHIAATPFAIAVDVVLGDLDCIVTPLREALKTAAGDEVGRLLKDFHDAARALHTEIDLPAASAWGKQLASARAEAASLLEGEMRDLPAQVRRLLRPRNGREAAVPLDSIDVDEVEAKLALVGACRNYAGELAVSEATRRVHSELQTYFDSGTQVLLERLRASPPAERALRQGQVDAAIRFCAKLFGAEYAGLLARAADIAARGEQKAAKG